MPAGPDVYRRLLERLQRAALPRDPEALKAHVRDAFLAAQDDVGSPSSGLASASLRPEPNPAEPQQTVTLTDGGSGAISPLLRQVRESARRGRARQKNRAREYRRAMALVRQCPVCGRWLSTTSAQRSTRQTCSDRCRQRAYRQRRAARRGR
jgi:hypothetical protein